MSIIAFKNIFNDDIVRNIDAFYQRFAPQWDLVVRFQLDMLKGFREYTFYIKCCPNEDCSNTHAISFPDDDDADDVEEEEEGFNQCLVKFEDGELYFALVESEDNYRPQEGEHIFHKSNSEFPRLVKMVVKHFWDFEKEETT